MTSSNGMSNMMNQSTAAIPPSTTGEQARNGRVVFWLVLLVAGMTALSFAAVPLYQLFCQVTGYGGTTQRAVQAPSQIVDRVMTVRLDANVAPGLPWSFRPETREITLKIGENQLGFYKAINLSQKTTVGTATFNVTPEIAGRYFNKIECFCFTEQSLQPGQAADMPVSFFIDPAILDDKDASYLEDITLSYTFFPVNKAADAAGEKAPGHGSGNRS